MDLNWSADGYHKLTVTFAFTSWRDNSLETLAMDFLENVIADSMFRSNSNDILQSLVPAGTIVPANQSLGPGEEIINGFI
jgi:hypothetical protein